MYNTDESRARNAYNAKGKEYLQERVMNEYIELPGMLKVLGNIRGKKILDIACGAGGHAILYKKRGANVTGIDISETMITIARARDPHIRWDVGSVRKLPYRSKTFDIVTGSLMSSYMKDLTTVFKEAARVLKPHGLLYFTQGSPLSTAKERIHTPEFKISGVGYIRFKKTNKVITFGQPRDQKTSWELPGGMWVQSYERTLRTHLRCLRDAGFELIDVVDLYPIKKFKTINPKKYEQCLKCPMYSVYVGQKKK